jgi:predicted small lipoprotein YifL
MLCWARYIFAVVVVALGVLAMAGSCGRKGPLYLPEDTPARQAPAPSTDVPSPPSGAPKAPTRTNPGDRT